MIFRFLAYFCAGAFLGACLPAQSVEVIPVRDLNPVGDSFKHVCGSQKVVAGGTTVYFYADAGYGCELFRSDGTPAGTASLSEIVGVAAPPGGRALDALPLAIENGFVYFVAEFGDAVWKTDFSPAGTQRVVATSDVDDMVIKNGVLYFRPASGELFRTDGTVAGTRQVFGVIGRFAKLQALGNFVVFSNGLTSVVRTDGTEAGTVTLKADEWWEGAENAAAGSSQLFFRTGLANELWRTDGTVAGTRKIAGTTRALIGVVGNIAIFSTSTGLWRSDGTAGGTFQLAANIPGSGVGSRMESGWLYFVSGPGGEVWRTDGSAARTSRVNLGDPPFNFVEIHGASRGAVYFSAAETGAPFRLRLASSSGGSSSIVPFGSSTQDVSVERDTAVALAEGFFFQATGESIGKEPYVVRYDTSPEPIPPQSRTNVAASTSVTFSAQVRDINSAVDAAVSNGSICVSSSSVCACDIASHSATSRSVGPFQYLCVRHQSAAAPLMDMVTNVSIGGISTAFTSTSSEGPKHVQFSSSTAVVLEGQVLNLIVTRSGYLGSTARVSYVIGGGTAVVGEDYPDGANGVLEWAAGDGASKVISLATIGDGRTEPTKTFLVTLSAPDGVELGTPSVAAVTLQDDDNGIAFIAERYEFSESQSAATLQVIRTGNLAGTASIKWTTQNGTAAAGTDFGAKAQPAQRSGTVSWSSGDGSPKSIVIPLLQDVFSDGEKYFTVLLSNPSTGQLVGVPGTARVNISDDEVPAESRISFVISKIVVLESDGQAVLTLRRQPVGGGFSRSATVSYATVAGTALATSDYTPKSGTVIWAIGDSSDKTITIPLAINTTAEVTKAFTVTIVPTVAGIEIAMPIATVVIIDDDELFPKFGAIPAGWVVPASATKGWHVSNDAGAFEGVFSLRSDQIENNESAGVEVTRTFASGNITFRVKVSSELTFDRLRFFVDDVEKGTWSGTAMTGWQVASIPVTAGTHTVRWSYEKDASGSVGQDAAWIDAVVLP